MRPSVAWLAFVLVLPIVAAAPEQVHLGIPDSDAGTTRSVLWYEATPNADPKVVLETAEGARTVAGKLVPGPTAGFAYEATLTGLAPGMTYTYRVGDRAFTLATPPAGATNVTLVALGDMGTKPASAATVKTLQEIAPDLILHAGDISYAEGDPVEWAKWFTLVEPVAAHVPWVTAIGNHEADVRGASLDDTSLVNPGEQAFYKQRFGLPGNELWYSFDWQGVHIIALDTYSQVSLPAEEVAWLDADLAAHADAEWTLVFLHEPPYSSNSHGPSPRVQQAFVPLFEKHKVDVVLAAHDHAYERFDQLVGGKSVATDHAVYAKSAGPLYIVSGGAGESLYDGWRSPLGAGSVAHSATHHVTKLHITADRIDVAYVPTDGADFSDAFTIVRASAASVDDVPAAVTRDTPSAGPLAMLAALAALALFRFRSR